MRSVDEASGTHRLAGSHRPQNGGAAVRNLSDCHLIELKTAIVASVGGDNLQSVRRCL